MSLTDKLGEEIDFMWVRRVINNINDTIGREGSLMWKWGRLRII